MDKVQKMEIVSELPFSPSVLLRTNSFVSHQRCTILVIYRVVK